LKCSKIAAVEKLGPLWSALAGGGGSIEALVTTDVFLFEGFRLDRRGGGLFRRDDAGVFGPVPVGSRALEVLGVLVARSGELVTKDELLNAVWPGTVVEGSNLPVQIAALRRVLDEGRADGSCIQTIAGRGYRFLGKLAREGGDPRPRLSIVVLPFTNLSGDSEQQYFADALTDDVTTDLSRLAGMLVISRNTAFTYRNKPVDTKQIGRALGVRYVLEGSVLRSGNRVRVNAQLIDAETDAHLWAERFNGDTSDLFALQDEITSRIAIALNFELIGAEAFRPTEQPDALDYIFRARAVLLKPRSRDNYAEAIGLYERALAIDPASVEARSGVASYLCGRVLDDMTDSPAADLKRAESLASQALAASPLSPLAHFAKGQVLRARDQYKKAIPEYETAIAFNRNWVSALSALADCRLHTGPIEEVIPLQEQVVRLSPRDPNISNMYARIGSACLLQSQIEEAIVWFEKARDANPVRVLPHVFLAAAYGLKSETERAAAELAEARKLVADDRFSSIARLKELQYWGVPKIEALYETTFFAGLRKAGMPEE
jgi:adenylate cyclase